MYLEGLRVPVGLTWESGTRTIGPSGLVFYDGDLLPQNRGDLFLCGVNTGALMRLQLARSGQDRVEAAEEPPEQSPGGQVRKVVPLSGADGGAKTLTSVVLPANYAAGHLNGVHAR